MNVQLFGPWFVNFSKSMLTNINCVLIQIMFGNHLKICNKTIAEINDNEKGLCIPIEIENDLMEVLNLMNMLLQICPP